MIHLPKLLHLVILTDFDIIFIRVKRNSQRFAHI